MSSTCHVLQMHYWEPNTAAAAAAATAAAKSLQSCPTLCDPRDGSPPGSPVSRILQARTLEWVSISFSNAWKWKWSRSVVSDSLQPHGLQPTRLLHPWDFPGKSTGVGCHCLLRAKHYVPLKKSCFNKYCWLTQNIMMGEYGTKRKEIHKKHKKSNDRWRGLSKPILNLPINIHFAIFLFLNISLGNNWQNFCVRSLNHKLGFITVKR